MTLDEPYILFHIFGMSLNKFIHSAFSKNSINLIGWFKDFTAFYYKSVKQTYNYSITRQTIIEVLSNQLNYTPEECISSY